MKKYILSLSEDNDYRKILFIGDTHCYKNKTGFFQRNSPIFLVNKDKIEANDFKDGYILLVYTLDSFFNIGRLVHYLKDKEKDIYVFQTLGLSSILIYSPTKSDTFDSLITKLDNNIIGFEL